LTAGEPIISLFLYFSAFLLLFITCSPSPLLACSVLPKAKRRGRDSNPWYGVTRTQHFQCCAFSRSATSPAKSKNNRLGADFQPLNQELLSYLKYL
jgi:hypothetical protein